MRKISLFLAIIMIVSLLTACGETGSGIKEDNEETVKIETREELLEIMGGVIDADFETLWVYHFLLADPYYICGYVVPNDLYFQRGFVLGDSDYTLTYPTIEVLDNHFDESDYEEKSFVYIKALPNGEDGVRLRDISPTATEDIDYLSVEEYCEMSKTIHNTYFEITGFIGSITENDDYWTCKIYESEEVFKDKTIDWGVTLLFDEYPSNINGTTVRVVGKYSPLHEEPMLLHCSIVEE